MCRFRADKGVAIVVRAALREKGRIAAGDLCEYPADPRSLTHLSLLFSKLEGTATRRSLPPVSCCCGIGTSFGGETETGTSRPPGVDFVIDKPVTLEKVREALSIVT